MTNEATRVISERPAPSGTAGRVLDIGSFGSAEEVVDFVETVLEASTAYSIIAMDLAGKIVLWNHGARRLYGYESAEIIGQPNSILHTKEDVEAGLPARMMDGARDKGKWEGTIQRRRKAGSRFTAKVVVTPLRDRNSQPTGFLVISSDISEAVGLALEATENKRYETQLLETNDQLETASQAKDRFLANMSHELRTPLNAVLGFTGTILMGLSGPLTDQQRSQLETVRANGNHLLSIINDLLDLAQIESGEIELNFEQVDCRAVVDEVVSGLRPLADEKGIDFQSGVPGHAVVVDTDRRALSQILINLANNAIKVTNEGSVRIELSSQENGGPVTRFSIVDTGVGIKAADRETLFAAFQQVASSTSRRHEGTGLGLYISQRLALLIQGEIDFESEYGKGSTFVLQLRSGGQG
jgi:PAS domain S-box-containing protein